MKACIFVIFFFRNFSFSSFRIFRSMVLREKRKNCWSFRKRKQLKFISRPWIRVTGGRQPLKASWRYCCSLLFRRISGQAMKALERALATRHAGEKGSMALPRPLSPYISRIAPSSLRFPYWPHFLLFPSCFFQNRTWRLHREDTGWAPTFSKTDTCALRVSVVKPQTRPHTTTKPLFFSLSQYQGDNNLHDMAF